MTHACTPANKSAAAGLPEGLTGFAVWLFRLPEHILMTLACWQKRHMDRRHLASLDDRILTDIGITREDAAQEAKKPFWRP